jgi:hypothetical protein
VNGPSADRARTSGGRSESRAVRLVAAAAVEVAILVCVPSQQPGAPATVPSSPAQALAGLEASLEYLAAADVADWPAEALAGWLRALGRAAGGGVAGAGGV